MLQHNAVLGNVAGNMENIRRIIRRRAAGSLDLLILPEMAMTGYAFSSLGHIRPHLPKAKAQTLHFATELCRIASCTMVVIGYPEMSTEGKNYNSSMIVQGDHLLYNYRKTHLYETDESWATEGQHFGSYHSTELSPPVEVKIAIGICMDLNPYQCKCKILGNLGHD